MKNEFFFCGLFLVALRATRIAAYITTPSYLPGITQSKTISFKNASTGRRQSFMVTNNFSKLHLSYSQTEQDPQASEKQSLRDLFTIGVHVLSCFLFALLLSFYEGYDCAFLKPETATIRNFPSVNLENTETSAVKIMKYGTRGMGRGKSDRVDGWYQDTYYGFHDGNDSERTIREVLSYNEIMELHRNERVPNWKQEAFVRSSNYRKSSLTEEEARVRSGVQAIYNALDTTIRLKQDASEYDWDKMSDRLQSPVMRRELEDGCSALKGSSQILTFEAREEIGFNWGSCAWRHCGAQADAEETIAELYNSIGLFEPFECLFTLDIIERALRDILTVIPSQYHPKESKDALQTYFPYQSQALNSDNDAAGEFGGNGDTLDNDFLSALYSLRNTYVENDE